MNKIIIGLLLLALQALATSLNGQSKELNFRHLTVENGLSNGEITTISQDKVGFIWIGTSSGLNRYDGYTTQVFYNNAQPKIAAFQNRIYGISIASNNFIWLATEGGLCLFNPATSTYTNVETSNSKEANLIKQPVLKVIATDKKIYMVSSKSIYAFEVNELNVLKQINLKSFPLNAPIFGIEKDNKEQVWLTHSGFLSVFDKNNIEKRINVDKIGGHVFALLAEANGNIYVSMERGLFKLSKKIIKWIEESKLQIVSAGEGDFEKISDYNFDVKNTSYLHSLKKDNAGNFWLGSSAGLKKITNSTASIETYGENGYSTTAITSNFLTSIFIDRSSCLWAGTFGGGVNIADLNGKDFRLLRKSPNTSNTLSSNHIRALLEEDNGSLWIGTSDGGLNYFDATTQNFTVYNKSNSALESDNIRSLTKDKNNNLWVATQTTISARNSNGTITNLKPGLNDNTVSGNYTNVTTDIFNQIWTGSWGNGLCRIVNSGNKQYSIEHITQSSAPIGLLSNKIAYIYADKNKPEILVGTDHGLNHIFLKNDGSIQKIINYEGDSKNFLSSSFIRQIVRQGDSTIWVSTYGGSINKINLLGNGKYAIEHLGKNINSLRDIELVLIDNKGDVWLAGSTLAKYNTTKKEFIYFDGNDGLQGNNFLKGAAFKGANNKLYFGGNNGITYFNPNSISQNSYKPTAVFSNIIVNGVSNNNLEINKNANEPISYKREITLSELENNFTIQFSSMHFANPTKCNFKYKLEGYDKNWNSTNGANRNATYANLNFGTYTLKVMASNNDGLWTDVPAELKITIVAPWWKTTSAKIVYFLILLGIGYTIWHNKQSLFNLKRKLAFKDLEEKKQEELHQMKLQFFTNISHEFRTPLTLILGPTEKMLHIKTNEQQSHDYLRLIYSNARRLLGLVNELMDFRQSESNMFKLKISENKIEKLVTGIANEFKEMAEQRNIKFNIVAEATLPNTYFDPNIVEKIIVNLLSNAFKYTENNGKIEIEILESLEKYKPPYSNSIQVRSQLNEKKLTWIRVSDTGIGIDDKSIVNIFDRYYRVNTTGNEKQLGTGVGLALVKSLVELHKGYLKVFSNQAVGSEFLIGLPLYKTAYNTNELQNNNEHKIDFENLQYTVDWLANHDKANEIHVVKETNNKPITKTGLKRILVVEDNEEMRRFLVNSFNDDYEVIEAVNGIEGYTRACENLPDLIVSDLMMPELDGNGLCKKIREDISLCHTPFILITANASVETHIKSTENGADIYFPKPFSLRLLQATIKNLFESRDKLKEKYNQDVFADTREIVTNQKDKEFLDELIEVIEQNMENEELDINLICRKIGMSRTKLYGKVKIITGQSIGDFTRLLKLKKAAKLMIAEDLPIGEVMNRVGIQSQSYFIKQFKKEFGKTPAAYVAEFSA